MPRTFSLAAVLAVRRQKESAEERALAAAAVKVTESRTALDHLEEQVRQMADARARAGGTVYMAVHLHAEDARWKALGQARAHLLREIDSLETKRLEQQARYLDARRDREMLTELQQKQKIAFEAELQSREQKRIEDLFTARHLRE